MIPAKVKKILICYIPVVFCTLVTLFPFYWILCTSLKPESTIMSIPLKYFPNPITADNYIRITSNFGFGKYFMNSLIVSITTTLIITMIAIMGGYAVSRYKFKGKKGFMMLLLLTQMLPGVVILIPLFTIFNKLGLINSLWSLVFTNTAINLPFCLIMMSGFFSGLPPTLEEAAQIDGCTRLRAILIILVPAIMPGIVSSGSFAFVNSWNEFVFSLNFINNARNFTLPIGLSMMKGEFSVNYGGLAAGTVIALIPVLAIFCYIQKYLVKGLAAGAVKG